MDRAQFSEHVADALSRLHDRRHLEGHPLGKPLARAGQALDAGGLQRVLLDAIRDLRPGDAGPYRPADWRRYRHLIMRYLDGVEPAEVARQLGVSERQARRDHHEALEALAALLWARRSSEEPEPTRTVTPTITPEETSENALEAELARFAAAPPAGQVLLDRVLGDALETIANLAQSRGVTVELALPAELLPVAASHDALRHILVSVLSAGVDWDPESRVLVGASNAGDEVELRLAVHRRLKGHRAGPGRPFLETDHAPSLHVARRLAEMQAGRLEMQETDQGELRVYLCLKAFRPATILVVDDNPDFVRLFGRYLGGLPYRVLEAKVPGEALRLAAEAHPDVITLDVMMPSQDGWQVLRELKRCPSTRDIPVVVVSVLRERALALSLGATDFLAKPITQQALLAALARCSGISIPAAPAGSPSPPPPTGPPGD